VHNGRAFVISFCVMTTLVRRVLASHGFANATGFVAAFCGALACSGGEIDGPLNMSTPNGNPGNGGVNPTPGNTGGGMGTPMPTATGTSGGAQPPAGPSELLLDDLSDGNGTLSVSGINGEWGTYSDGTSAVTPPAMSAIVPVDGAIHVTGNGFSMWGAGLSLALSGAGAMSVDISTYTSLKLRAKGTGTITVEVATPATTGSEEGGECTGEGCFGHYARTITMTPEYTDHVVTFSSLSQPEWGQTKELELDRVSAINLLSRKEGDQNVNIDLWVDSISLVPPAATVPGTGGGGGVVVPADGTNPFVGKTFASDGGAAQNAMNSASGADRDLLGKIAGKPSAYWVSGDPTSAGRFADGGAYPVIVAYNIPDRDCSGQSAGGAGSADAYRGWIDAMSSSLQGKSAAIILEPDALALDCSPQVEELLKYAVTSLRQNPGVAVYLDGAHSNWVPAGDMAGRLRNAGVEIATGFALNVSNFEPTSNLIAYGKAISSQIGNKPFVIDTSRNGKGSRGGEWCNPAGAGLGEAPSINTGDPLVHAFLWVKRPGESDGACGQCGGVPAGQFCTGYALELARNAVF
jgi:endoglucanase